MKLKKKSFVFEETLKIQIKIIVSIFSSAYISRCIGSSNGPQHCVQHLSQVERGKNREGERAGNTHKTTAWFLGEFPCICCSIINLLCYLCVSVCVCLCVSVCVLKLVNEPELNAIMKP